MVHKHTCRYVLMAPMHVRFLKIILKECQETHYCVGGHRLELVSPSDPWAELPSTAQEAIDCVCGWQRLAASLLWLHMSLNPDSAVVVLQKDFRKKEMRAGLVQM